MAAKKTIEDKVIDAALELAAEKGWGALTLADIAQSAEISLADMHSCLAHKGAILSAYSRRTDVAVLRALDPEDQEGESPKDRLFGVVMMRFDELQKHKTAVADIAHHLARDPFGLLAGAKPALRSMHWMLEAANIDAGGIKGAVRARALAVVWLAVFRVWLEDEIDLSKTMAELDRRLQQSAALWGREAEANGEG
jgi:ubiquinone biosynthesis protein COQ9